MSSHRGTAVREKSAGALGALVPAEENGTDAGGQPTPHPATLYFAARLRELMDGLAVRSLETGRTRKLTVRRLQQLLHEQAPELAVSQTHMYRYVHGEARPSVTLVYELAVLFGVAPTYFLPDDLLPED
ncbi:helix-turn-helix domain-containing protein [Mycolicibacterium neoaurum]|uniref:helix-turn-helix domain-containing protein n=1 Tax=Mycolicibacterium neoaurum TaxID=1795 RepID=UPI001F4D0521|nr:helix-turn-helix transcriptional regulator [Mycolicibacterium neoaurum]